eukprot:CAMPEP_0194399884 /NCGR_PEP_ID=MMETSP0174-20130528/126907_1 /TAXON_ID=216777 /ORGANISM="Proboscia alata, Strain PI-D3" /LENGTH=499 /DNA_ID=CAMNT_0039196341 /DNA_START=980 /DNA_END=2479 /DNA_ORIENTATION=+
MACDIIRYIDCECQPLGISFHPTKPIVAAALVNGCVEWHTYSEDEIQTDNDGETLLSSITVFENQETNSSTTESTSPNQTETQTPKPKTNLTKTNSCRAVSFGTTHDTHLLYACGNNGSLVCIDINTSSILWRIENAHPHGINRMLHFPASPSPAAEDTDTDTQSEDVTRRKTQQARFLATGDDEGMVRLWDTQLCHPESAEVARSKKLPLLPLGCVSHWNIHTDYISDLVLDDKGTTMLVSSGDCTLSACNLLRLGGYETNSTDEKDNTLPKHVLGRTADQDDELLSIAILKRGKKVVVGTQLGILNCYSWNSWSDLNHRFPGHPHSIDALLKIDEDTMLTGSSDGVIRIVQIQPDRLLGMLGGHHDGLPVEQMRFGGAEAKTRVLGSISHDEKIRIWDASVLFDDDDDDDMSDVDVDETDTKDVGNTAAAAAARIQTKRADNKTGDDEWEDMDEDLDLDSLDDSDSDSDDSDMNSKKSSKGSTKKFQTENEKFFQDM